MPQPPLSVEQRQPPPEVVAEELGNEELPVSFAVAWAVDDTERIRTRIKLPDPSILELANLGKMAGRELYEDVCCAVLLRFAHEVFRVIPDARDLVMVGYREEFDPATGYPARAILLRMATDRDSLTFLDLENVDPSSAFDRLGGTKKTRRGELIPMTIEPDDDSAP